MGAEAYRYTSQGSRVVMTICDVCSATTGEQFSSVNEILMRKPLGAV
jgi:hypothetical protein